MALSVCMYLLKDIGNFSNLNSIITLGGILMFKNLLTFISVPLVIVHVIILYFWIGDWEKLVTEIGLISWIGSIVLGVVVYIAYRISNHSEKRIIVTKKIVFCSTLMTLFLGMFSIMIEAITNSMP